MELKTILEKTYAGFLGMNIGIRMGAPVEPSIWSHERIRRFYGDIDGYVKPFINFAADDDVNGPVYFLRALEDNGCREPLTSEMVADAWLNYAREGVGMFWWGGYGVSTEHTAYLNLLHGIPARESGSVAVNGRTLAEQIGGQIFIDTWGFVSPGNPTRAARLARTAASVSHDGEGLNGAVFIASAIANAYVSSDIEEIIASSLSLIPGESLYHRVVEAVLAFHEKHPDSWRSCMEYLISSWGYDRYPGICPIIPNAGVCAMALVYGRTFEKGVEIATMAGWDTDCNAGNVGSILGVMGSLPAIPAKFREPVNDGVVLSGISGYLNILDIPTYAKKLCALGALLSGDEVPPLYRTEDGVIDFDFSLPGSTHCFRLSDPSLCRMMNGGGGTLDILFDGMVRGQSCKVYYKNFYRRKDFSDERYMPVFSPTAYSGQKVSFTLSVEKLNGETIVIQPYVRDTHSGEEILLGGEVIRDGEEHAFSFTIPERDGAFIDEIGFLIEGNSPSKNKDFGLVRLSSFSIRGDASYTIDIAKQKKEFASVTGFSHNHGAWEIDGEAMRVMCLSRSDAMTGSYYGKDESVECDVRIDHGSSALLGVRIEGAMRGYQGGLADGKLVIGKTERGVFAPLAEVPYPVTPGSWHRLAFSAEGKRLSCSVDGKVAVAAEDGAFRKGMVGCTCLSGRAAFRKFAIRQQI